MLARQGGDPAQCLAAVDRTGRVVGVDHHQRLGLRRDFRLHVGQVGLPAVGLITQVVHRRAAGQRGRGGPQRIVGSRDEDLITVVEQGLQGHRDQLGDAVAEEDRVDVEAREVGDKFVAGHHGAAR